MWDPILFGIVFSSLGFVFVGALFQILLIRRLKDVSLWWKYVETWRRYPWFLSSMYVLLPVMAPVWYVCAYGGYCFAFQGTFQTDQIELDKQAPRDLYIIAQLYAIPSILTLFVRKRRWNLALYSFNLFLVVLYVLFLAGLIDSGWASLIWTCTISLVFVVSTASFTSAAVAWGWLQLAFLLLLLVLGYFITLQQNEDAYAAAAIWMESLTYLFVVLLWEHAVRSGSIQVAPELYWKTQPYQQNADRHLLIKHNPALFRQPPPDPSKANK